MIISNKTISDIIQENIPFRQLSTGWLAGKCAVCNDYKERAGFKIDGDVVAYNCWNCSTTAIYKNSDNRISKTFRKILNSYNISDNLIDETIGSTFFLKKPERSSISLKDVVGPVLDTPEVKLPPKTFRLGGTDEFAEHQEKIINYLLKRRINVFTYPFYFSIQEKYLNRVIIPFYRSGKLIYWQARAIDNLEKERYLNCPAKRDAIIFNFDRIYDVTPTPLIVSEGVFNALIFNGVSILGSKLNESKIEILSKSPRDLIFIIDKDKNGKSMAYSVLEHGWNISFAPLGAKDLNESAMKYGKIWTAKTIIENRPKNIDEAKLMIETYCI